MFVPYTPLTQSRSTPRVRAIHSVLTLLLLSFMIIVMVQADPNHHYAIAFINAAGNWLHAAFPQLIK